MTSDRYLAKMHEENARRLGDLAARVTSDVLTGDGFDWRADNARGEAIARHFRQLDRNADFGDAITEVICGVYTEFGHDHDPAIVRAEIAWRLDGTT